jgi:hypothetical protein
VTSALTPPVILPRPAAGRQPRGRPGAPGTLPLAASPGQVPALTADVVYGLGRIDPSGRVADRTVTCALGWRSGDRLTLTASAGVVTARRDPNGLAILPPRHCIALPRPCGTASGYSPETRRLALAVPGRRGQLLMGRAAAAPSSMVSATRL